MFTVIVTLSLALPPSPLQSRLYVDVTTGLITTEPAMFRAPPQPPEAAQLIAFVELQFKVVDCPFTIREAETDMLTTGAAPGSGNDSGRDEHRDQTRDDACRGRTQSAPLSPERFYSRGGGRRQPESSGGPGGSRNP